MGIASSTQKDVRHTDVRFGIIDQDGPYSTCTLLITMHDAIARVSRGHYQDYKFYFTSRSKLTVDSF